MGMGRVRYTYDAFHRRLSKESNGKITDFLYQCDDEIGSFTDGKITELRLLGSGCGAEIGAAVAIELQGTPYVPIHDTLGNVTTLLDLSGKVFACYRYTAFGEEETHGNLLNPWRFASKRADPETGFIHFGRRYYLPAVGRWLTPDPLWFADGPNLYAYVHNHPLAYTDPDGQFAFFLIPLAISLAAEYLLPTAAVYMSEYAGGALAASFVMGMASGYSDTVSTVFDGGTYSLGEADLSSFVCSRAGMIVGAAIAALPTSRGAKLTTTAGNMALSHVSGTVVAQGEKALARQVTNYAKTSATQKTTQVAEKYFVNRGVGNGVDVLQKLGLKDGMKCSTNRALELGEQFLGKGYKEVVPEAEDTYQPMEKEFSEWGTNDILGKHGNGPHINFETLVPKPQKPGKMFVDKTSIFI